jgi:hypothetical protein
MGPQGLALVGTEKRNVAGLRLRLSQARPEAQAVDGVSVLDDLTDQARKCPVVSAGSSNGVATSSAAPGAGLV